MDNKICRVCLKSEQSGFKSLYEEYKEYLLFEYINTISGIIIKRDDGFPDKICQFCFKQLQTAINFKEQCEKSNTILIETTSKDIFFQTAIKNECNIKLETVIKPEVKTQEEYLYFSELSDKEYEDTNLDINYSASNKTKNVDTTVQCHDCGNKFKTKCKLRVHWKREHMLSKLICDKCKRTFKTYKAFHRHNANKSMSCRVASDEYVSITGLGKNRLFTCKECGYKSRRIKDMGTHLVTHTGAKPFQCNLCPKRFSQLSSLQSHKECLHSENNSILTCHICGKNVKGTKNLTRHLKLHTEAKVTCKICNKTMNKLSFKTHMLRHSGAKSFTCEICAGTFYSSAELCNHKRWVHHTESLYECDLCKYKTRKPNILKLHRRRHTSVNFACKNCGRFYSSVEKLVSHEKSHNSEKKFSCSLCDAKFYNRNSVAKHKKSKHELAFIAEKVDKEKKINAGIQVKESDIDV